MATLPTRRRLSSEKKAMDLLLSPSGGGPSRCPFAPPAETAPGEPVFPAPPIVHESAIRGSPMAAQLHPHLLHKLMSPFSVLMRTRALPAPSRNCRSRPGAYSSVRSGFGPKQLRISPLKLEMSNSAWGLPTRLRRTSPLMLSKSSRASGVAFALTPRSPLVLRNRDRVVAPRSKSKLPLTVLPFTSPATFCSRASPLTVVIVIIPGLPCPVTVTSPLTLLHSTSSAAASVLMSALTACSRCAPRTPCTTMSALTVFTSRLLPAGTLMLSSESSLLPLLGSTTLIRVRLPEVSNSSRSEPSPSSPVTSTSLLSHPVTTTEPDVFDT